MVNLGDLGSRLGVHDVADRLGFRRGEISLVVLEAARRWEAADAELAEPKLVLLRSGRVRLEFGDGTVQILDRTNSMWANRQALVSMVNLEPGIAEILLVSA